MKDVNTILVMYGGMKPIDDAVKLAEEHFSDPNLGPDEFEAKLIKLGDEANETHDVYRLLVLMSVKGYVTFPKVLQYAGEEVATEILRFRTENDALYEFLDHYLQKLGTTYTELCLREKKFLTPSELDDIVFQEFAPDSAHLSQTYFNYPGMAIVFQNRLGKEAAAIIYDKTKMSNIVDESHADLGFISESKGIDPDIRRDVLKGVDSQKVLLSQVRERMQHEGIDETSYCIVYANNAALIEYLSENYDIKRMGSKAEEVLGILVMQVSALGYINLNRPDDPRSSGQ